MSEVVEISWTSEMYGDFVKAIEKAQSERAVTFMFLGHEMSVDYARYLSEYLSEVFASPTLH